jgi:4-hydroxy-tetrahydrodipicolinate reductase
MSLNIILIGYGRMGREVEQTAKARGHNILSCIDSASDWEKSTALFTQAHVAVDFSLPELANENILRCFNLGLPIVVGTTAWYHQLENIRQQCLNGGHSLFYAPNFSLGMNIVFNLNKQLARLLNHTDYKLSITETHHKHKLDAPSGTAIHLAGQITGLVDRYVGWSDAADQDISLLPVVSVRTGEVPGTHEIIADSAQDTIRIIHEAKGRQGFALGAVLAAEFLAGRIGVFTMDDLLDTLLRE